MTVSKQKIDIILANKRMNAKELCETIGISRNRFYTVLNSKNVNPKTVGRLAAALGVDVTEIIETE